MAFLQQPDGASHQEVGDVPADGGREGQVPAPEAGVHEDVLLHRRVLRQAHDDRGLRPSHERTTEHVGEGAPFRLQFHTRHNFHVFSTR